ncbi:MAG: 4Fe-4S binding protein [Ignavibacteriales bacterium]|nr:4Fe-4S binding protein [Ignavibacteriales bacterium]
MISLVFILSISLLFIDLTFSIQSSFSEYPLFLQFIPSLLSFISIGTVAGLGFLFVILLTLLFGRVYCSTICPFGILQDLITFLRKKIKRINFFFTKPFTKTRYFILSVTILLFFVWCINRI